MSMGNGTATANTGVCSSASVNGATDAWSCRGSDSASPDHLLVMVNGILGSATDWKFAAEQFVKRLPDKVFVHCSEGNVAKQTLDGVDVMGDRLAEEVLELIKRRANVKKISFIAHSVGGLVARYAIGKLYRPLTKRNAENSVSSTCEEINCGTICGLEAMNFVTVATPHLGSHGNKQVPFLFGVPAFEKLASLVIHMIFRRTGRHLFLTDHDEGKPPLLQRMVKDKDGQYFFMSALQTFKRRVVYSNVGYDHIVGWRTSCIRRNIDLPKLEDSSNEKYPHIVYEEHCKAIKVDECLSTLVEDDGYDTIEEELVRRMSQVSWEKIDVSFQNSRLRYAAHSIIQVKDQTIHSEGEDVISHMIDHFLV